MKRGYEQVHTLSSNKDGNDADNVFECAAFGGYPNPPPIPRSLHERTLQTRTTTSTPWRRNTRGRMP